MKTKLNAIDTLLICLVLFILLSIVFTICYPKQETFGSAVCKQEERHIHGKISSTDYFLVDENGHKKEVDYQLYNSLITVPTCKK